MGIVKIPPVFSKYTYTFKLVKHCANKAIYAQYDGEVLVAYEVVKIRVHPPRYNTFLKRNEPKTEIYPSSEQWGMKGWTFRTLERAMIKYNKL